MRHPFVRLALAAVAATLLGTPSDARAQRPPPTGGAGTLPDRPAARPAPLPASPAAGKDGEAADEGDGRVIRTQGRPGTLDVNQQGRIEFDPRTFGQGGQGGQAGAAASTEETAVEDVIEWRTNFEKGVRCQKLPLNARIRLDFNQITLDDLTKFISCITEQNFLLTGGARAQTVSILSPRPVTVYEAYRAYLSALEAAGLTVVPKGNFLEIVPTGEARQEGAPIYGPGRSAPATDVIVTRLIQLEHLQAEEILPVLERFKGKAGDLAVYAPTNTIIMTDTGANIQRILGLIRELDVPLGKEKIWIRPVQYADANEIVTILNELFGTAASSARPAATPARPTPAARGRGPQPQQQQAAVVGDSPSGGDPTQLTITKMLAVERTNSIIIVASRAEYLRIDRIIRKLDVPIPGEGQIHIHYLEHADAEEISQTLSSLTQGAGAARRTTTGARTGNQAAGGAPAAAGSLFEGEVKITAYQPTNALVVESSLKDYLALQRVIRQLDVQRKQVYVEAIIMEISQTKQRNLGLSGSGGTTFESDGEVLPLLFGVGGLGLDVSSALTTLQSGGGAVGLQGPLVDLSAGSTGGTTGGGTFSIPAFGFLLRALQQNTNANVLSAPHVLTLDNEEAEIQVGQRQPYLSSSLSGLGSLAGLGGLLGGTNTGVNSNLSGLGGLGALGALSGLGGLSGLGSSVDWVDIDLTLKIKPQVNSSDFVRLEIQQSLDNFDGLGVQGAPITSKRKVNNVVVVRDGQPVVIGGLMRDQETRSVKKVPFLGDVPVIGMLFRQTDTTVEKRNLLLIIIPHVIRDPSDLKRIHDERREEYREFARVMAERKKEFEGRLDYRKKVGLLEAVRQTVAEAESERLVREQAVFESSEVDRVGPPETHDIEYDPLRAAPPVEPVPAATSPAAPPQPAPVEDRAAEPLEE